MTKARKKKAEAVDLMAALEASLAPYKRPPHVHRMGASMYAGRLSNGRGKGRNRLHRDGRRPILEV